MEDYRVLHSIGKGSFGKVYLVRHVKEHRQYVMKVVKLKGIPPKERDACRNEVMLMQRLQHPNIVAYKDSFFANGRDNLCIVMTYCDGGDLAGRISNAKGHLFKEDQIMHWFVQIALGMHYMHENKVLHRDIKAQNIFLLGNGRLVLGDLGISKVLDGTVQFASTQIGTPYYMSPELFKNKPYNHKSDVWALGCVLYELCTLQHPFDATSLQLLSAKISKGIYNPISTKYSSALRSLIASLLAIEPKNRPSVAEVLQQPYLKKHIYNFIKDITERSNLGLGNAPVSNPSSGLGSNNNVANIPVSEGTMMFRAAALKAANVGTGAQDAFNAAVSAGLGPHANNLNNQLQALGLQSVAKQSIQDAMAAVSAPPTALKPAFSLANLQAPSSSSATPPSTASSSNSNPNTGAAALSVPSSNPSSNPPSNPSTAPSSQPGQGLTPPVIGPNGRPLSPNRARKYLKEQQAALEREEERKRAVESALARLKQEKELREKQREEIKKLQDRRISNNGIPNIHNSNIGSNNNGPPKVTPPSVGGFGINNNKPGSVSAVSNSSNNNNGLVVGPSRNSNAPLQSGGNNVRIPVGQPLSLPSSNNIPSINGGFAANAVAAANNMGIRNNNNNMGKVPIKSNIAALPPSLLNNNNKNIANDKPTELRERAAQIRKDAQSQDAARKAKLEGPGGSNNVRSNPSSRDPSPSANVGGGIVRSSSSSAPVVNSNNNGGGIAAAEKQRVADLDSWEKEKGILSSARDKPKPTLAALQAAVNMNNGSGNSNDNKNIVRSNSGGSGSASSSTKPSPVPVTSNPPTTINSIPSVSSSRSASIVSNVSSVSIVPPSSMNQPLQGLSNGLPPKANVPVIPRSSSTGSTGTGSGNVAAVPRSSSNPTDVSLETAQSTPYDNLSAKDRVLLQREARRKKEEEEERRRLQDAARESIAERAKAQYLTREQYRGVNVAIASSLPIAPTVLEQSVEDATILVNALSQKLPSGKYVEDTDDTTESKENDNAMIFPTNSVAPSNDNSIDEEQKDNYDDNDDDDNIPSSSRYADGELPESDDSEDEVLLESAKDESDGEPLPDDNESGTNSTKNNQPHRLPQSSLKPHLAMNDEADIVEVEQALRAELTRSTMRCADLRKSLDVARLVAVKAGVQIGSAVKGRRASAFSSFSGMDGGSGQQLSFDNVTIPTTQSRPPVSLAPGLSLPPSNYSPDDRPIRPAPAYLNAMNNNNSNSNATSSTNGASNKDSYGFKDIPTANSNPSPSIVPTPSPTVLSTGTSVVVGKPPILSGRSSVLSASAAATAASGGYISPKPSSTQTSPSPSTVSSNMNTNVTATTAPAVTSTPPIVPNISSSASLPLPVTNNVSITSTTNNRLSIGSNVTTTSSAAMAGLYDAPSLAPDQIYDNEEDEEYKDNDDEYEEEDDDIGDEDGDEEGQVAFIHHPSQGRRMHDGTIREEDENEDEEDEDDETNHADNEYGNTNYSGEGDDRASTLGRTGGADEDEDENSSTFGSGEGIANEFKTRLGIPPEMDTLNPSVATNYSTNIRNTNIKSTASNNNSNGNGSNNNNSNNMGSLSSRVEDLRWQCIQGLGEETFEAVYAAVKAAMWDDEDAEVAASVVGDVGEEHMDVAAIPAQLGLDSNQTEYVELVVSLLHMEQDLL